MTAHLHPGTSRILWWSAGIALFTRLLMMGTYPVADTTEARYAEIARKMLELGDWITPWYDYGVPFWAKPPLPTWLSATSMGVLGTNEFAARLPHFLAGLLVLWLLWDWLRERSPREAQLATVLLTGAALFYVSAGAVMTDMTLAVGLLMAMRGFWQGLHADLARRKQEGYAMFIGLAIGLLAKGPIALVLAGLPLMSWMLLSRNWRNVWRGLPWLGGTTLMLALTLPWYVAAELKTPGFLDYFLIGEHWQRFTVAGWSGDRYGHAHAFPRGSIWPFTLQACLPWSLLLPLIAFGRRPAALAPIEGTWSRYLWCWALTPVLFFTFAGNILWTYALPALPAITILAAHWLARDSRSRRVEHLLASGVLTTAVLLAIAIAWNDMRGTWKTAERVVHAWQTRGGGPLLFLGERPYSAAFYSRGRAELMVGNEALTRHLAGAATAYVVMGEGFGTSLPADLQLTLRDLGTYGRYTLYVYKPGRMSTEEKALINPDKTGQRLPELYAKTDWPLPVAFLRRQRLTKFSP